ncbi:MAG: diacylglycerol kinase family protein [bacterium]
MNITVIANPNASMIKDTSSFEEEIFSIFNEHTVNVQWTEKQEDAVKFAAESVKNGVDILIAVAGDGTVRELMPVLLGTNVKLGIIPAGTGNMIASNLDIPWDFSKACQLVLNGKTKRIDIGQINDKYFGFIAGCGVDAKIMMETTREKKDKLGVWAYFIEAFKHSLKVAPYLVKIRIDDKKIIRTKAVTVMAVNTGKVFGDLFTIAPNAKVDDGKLHLVIISPKNILDYLLVFFEFMFQKPLNRNFRIRHIKAKKAELTTNPSVLMQSDGDIIGKTPAVLKIIPSAIEVFIP